MARNSSKDQIVEAAEKLVARDGAAHLTLDAVAEAAGVSKGGLRFFSLLNRDPFAEGQRDRVGARLLVRAREVGGRG